MTMVQFGPRISQQGRDLVDALHNLASRGGRVRHITQGTIVEDMLRVYCGQLMFGADCDVYQVPPYVDGAGWPDQEEYRTAVGRVVARLLDFYGPGDRAAIVDLEQIGRRQNGQIDSDGSASGRGKSDRGGGAKGK